MKRSLSMEVDVVDGKVVVEILDNETGILSRIEQPYSPDEHRDFDYDIGEEIYSWLEIAEESQKEQEIEDIRTLSTELLSKAVGMDWAEEICNNDSFINLVYENVQATSAKEADGYYNVDDVKMSIGYVIKTTMEGLL